MWRMTLTTIKLANQIQTVLLQRIVPQLTKFMIDPSDPSRMIRPNVALAIVHVLCLFPPSITDIHIPPIITSAPTLPSSAPALSLSLTRACSSRGVP